MAKVKSTKNSTKRLKISKRSTAALRPGQVRGCGRNWTNLCGLRR